MTELRRKGSWMVPVPAHALSSHIKQAEAMCDRELPYQVLRFPETPGDFWRSANPNPDLKTLYDLMERLAEKLGKQ